MNIEGDYMLDTVVFNRILDDKISIALPTGGISRLLVTNMQLAQLCATRDEQRRNNLLSVAKKVNPEKILAEAFCFDVDGAGMDEAKWCENIPEFEEMCTHLITLDKKSKKKVKNPPLNQFCDIVIGLTAINIHAIFVSDDYNLQKVVKEKGGRVIDYSQFKLKMGWGV